MSDPLSVSASVIGLLTAGVAITKTLNDVVQQYKDVPKFSKSVQQEVTNITAALELLHPYLDQKARASSDRKALIQVEHVVTTLTGCVITYSDLQALLDTLHQDPKRAFDKLKWVRREKQISALVSDLQYHKSSLTLILTTLQCQSLQEAEQSSRRLARLVEGLLQSSSLVACRMAGMCDEGSIIAIANDNGDAASTIRASRSVDRRSMLADASQGIVPQHAFEQDLIASRVYNRAIFQRQSMTSRNSTAFYTTALSVLSGLSLSQVSTISFYALPVYSSDLSNSAHYHFGMDGSAATEAALQVRAHAAVFSSRGGPVLGSDLEYHPWIALDERSRFVAPRPAPVPPQSQQTQHEAGLNFQNSTLLAREVYLRAEEDRLRAIEKIVQREIAEKREELAAREKQLREIEARMEREKAVARTLSQPPVPLHTAKSP
ncbi:uncharacterized protein AB675_4698 [Cyphellophora attinorum]|uniref:Azaphilone pigments biosynthesis cluster protein L N-terminal domain-containing protein n=1 Tax=Cyphellophora attinorum TaxID=1664694 RepID=A0A0N0NLC5_9EURO|nr:uncharacterized protein AB675_4698 [Phialophora attinorum]KPI39131.1 hypothetical protein AB675_4698 [Phialophora attinorum]